MRALAPLRKAVTAWLMTFREVSESLVLSQSKNTMNEEGAAATGCGGGGGGGGGSEAQAPINIVVANKTSSFFSIIVPPGQEPSWKSGFVQFRAMPVQKQAQL